ncbi:MAG: DUF1566 domain-containing protein, partial [Desulfobacterales bacterium]|nr:DUF1566 domain-containing protein [Desulfobacterales bacterium]
MKIIKWTNSRLISVIIFLILTLTLNLTFVNSASSVEGNISITDKYAWSENAGWHNFKPTNGGAVVYANHLTGYVWAENIGWVSLGSSGGGGSPYYTNTTSENWGVNRSGINLSGYGWSETAGWINFSSTHGQVTIDSDNKFAGYAWSESVGWVHFNNTSPYYNVAYVTGSASYLKITGSGSQTAGASQTITITAYDQYDNIDTAYTGDKTLTFSGATESANPITAPTCTDKTSEPKSFGTETSLTFANGQATCSMKLYRAETAALNATDGTISTSGDSLVVTVAPSSKSKLLFSNQPPSSSTAGDIWTTFTVEITDDYGNRTQDTDDITISPSSYSFSGTTTKTAVEGLATFDDISFTKATNVTVSATSSGNQSTTSASNSVTVNSSFPYYLNISGSGNQKAGYSQAIIITAVDMYGNTTTSYTGEKILSFSGANPSPNPSTSPTCTNNSNNPVYFGDPTLINFTDGQASSSMVLYNAESAYIEASDAQGGLYSQTPLYVTVSGGDKNTLLWVTQPSATIINAGIKWPSFSMEILDAYGNRTSDTVTVTASPSTGTFAGTATKDSLSGIVTFDDITYNTYGTITVIGQSTGLSDTSPSESITVNPFGSGVLRKTGMTTSYAGGDDGAIQAGVVWPSPRFIDNGDGTLTDKLTGLMWLKNASCLAQQTWDNAFIAISNLNTNPSSYTCSGYNKTYNDWRLPNINELKSLVNYQINYPSNYLNDQGFVSFQDTIYWTSTTLAYATTYADVVSFSYGDAHIYDKTNSFYILPVRGGTSESYGNTEHLILLPKTGQTTKFKDGDDGDIKAGVPLASTRFTDNGDGTVTDNMTGLMWLKNVNSFGSLSWQGALDAVADLNSNPSNYSDSGYSANHEDWYLPNIEELSSLIDRSKSFPAISEGHPFTNVQYSDYYYWSSTTVAATTSNAHTIAFNGYTTHDSKTNSTQFVTAVRRAATRSYGNLITSKTGAGSGSISSSPSGIDCGSNCSSPFAVNTDVTLTASPNSGSTFTGWSGGSCSGTLVASPNSGASYTGRSGASSSGGETCSTSISSVHMISANFNFTSATYFKITGSTGQTAGTENTVTITAYDSLNNVAVGYSGDKTLQFSGASSSANPSTSPTSTDKDNTSVAFGTLTTVHFTDGVATSVMKLYKSESATISVTDGSISTSEPSYQLPVNVTAGTTTKLLWVTQPSTSVTAGETWQPFTIEITDSYGNRISATDNITITPSSNSFSGTTVKAAVGGVATFDDITYTRSGTMTVTGSAADLISTNPSNSITVNPSYATYLKITGSNTQKAGEANAITISARDNYDNIATSYTGDKTIKFSGANASPTPPPIFPTCTDKLNSPVNFGSNATLNFTSGQASSSMILYNAETAVIEAEEPGDIPISTIQPDSTLSVTVTAGDKNKLLWSTQPASTVTAGATWTAFTIEITDAYGNRTSDTDNV